MDWIHGKIKTFVKGNINMVDYRTTPTCNVKFIPGNINYIFNMKIPIYTEGYNYHKK